MSGITPILDTLLHQVLGKRVDLPPPRDLNEAVKPMQAGTAPQAVHSDSRLDPRPLPAAVAAEQSSARSAAPATPPLSSPGSTSTHFSAAARDIAEVLARFPAPPSALKLVAPLLAVGAEGAPPTEVAARLKSSIDSSGLFYESHLARWYRGGLGREQLAREPQMLSGGRPLPEGAGQASTAPLVRAGVPVSGGDHRGGQAIAVGGSSAPPFSGERGGPPVATELQRPGAGARPSTPSPLSPPVSPAPSASPSPAPGASPGTSAAGSPERGAVTASVVANVESSPEGAVRERAVREWAIWEQAVREQPAAARPGGGESSPGRGEGAGHGVSEALQGVVRQQLEMLAMPVLRWEGDVWSGLFMAFTLHLPNTQARDGESRSADAGSGEEEWVSELRLEIAGLGDVQVSLRMFRDQLELGLAASSASLAGELAARRDDLKTRLARCGFETVSLRIGDKGARDD